VVTLAFSAIFITVPDSISINNPKKSFIQVIDTKGGGHHCLLSFVFLIPYFLAMRVLKNPKEFDKRK